MAAEKPVDMDVALAAHAFEQGFVAGASLKRKHVLGDPGTHKHWKAGYTKGLEARNAASSAYRDMLQSEKERAAKENP